MRVLIIYESHEKTKSNYYTNVFIDELNRYSSNNISEVFLSKNFSNTLRTIPYNFLVNEDSFTLPNITFNMFPNLEEFFFISSQIENSNLIIFVPSENDHSHENMKALLKSLSYSWMPHKANKKLQNIIGIILSYAPTLTSQISQKDMKYDLLLWGLKNVFQINTIKYKNTDYDLNILKLSLMANKTSAFSKAICSSKCFLLESLKDDMNFKKNKFKFIFFNSPTMKNIPFLSHR
ncbi:MAG: hypothetical protein E7208_09330 [Clostridium butyricum]|nr:hypothetical protein [Clostridium butyricum]